MNRRGIALAADSAVTLGDGQKIYNTAEKLFSLAPDIPVGIMTFGSADIMGAPWKTVIKMYARNLGGRTFGTLREYGEHFLTFIQGADALFPASRQAEYVGYVIGAVWSEYARMLRNRIQQHERANPNCTLLNIIDDDRHMFERYDALQHVGSGFGERVLSTYRKGIEKIESELFEASQFSQVVRDALYGVVPLMFDRQWIHPAELSGIVIAGIGEDEAFPGLIEYGFGSVAADKLRYIKEAERYIGIDTDASIIPLAQRNTIDMVIDGVHPSFRRRLWDGLEALEPKRTNGKSKTPSAAAKLKVELENYLSEHHEEPFMTAVSGLPRQDLAKLAESLVSLTAFVMRMSFDQHETVAEPVDVALLSKGDRFTWVKRKYLMKAAGVQ